MKPSWLVTISLFVLLAAAGAAQTSFRITVNIPFDFEAYSKWMPAGEYELQSVAGNLGVLLRDVDAKNNIILLPRIAGLSQPNTQAKFVFTRYSDTHYLTAVVVPSGHNLAMPLTRTQKQVMQAATRGEERTVLAGTPRPKR